VNVFGFFKKQTHTKKPNTYTHKKNKQKNQNPWWTTAYCPQASKRKINPEEIWTEEENCDNC